MSGGYFDYNYSHIQEVIEQLEYLLTSDETRPIRKDLAKVTLDKMEEGLEILQKAKIYAQRIEWLISGDDSEESFHRRLEEDLEEVISRNVRKQ